MAFTLEFDENGVARVVAVDEVLLDETIDAVRRLYADPRFKVPTRIFWDLRAGRLNIDADEIGQLADFVLKNRVEGRGRTAVVAHDDLAFGMSRMYELLIGDIEVEVQVFREAEPALEWLQEDF